MRSKLFCTGILALLLPLAAKSASAQADYAARDAISRFAVGGGISGFNPGWGSKIMYGPTVWGDYKAPFISNFISGVAIEGEFRSILWNTDRWNTAVSDYKDANSRLTTLSGGLIYHPRILKFHAVSPYVKYLAGVGWTPFWRGWGPPFVVNTLGGGADYNLSRHLAVRAEYEYTLWRNVPSYEHPGQSGTDNPQGITLGVLYRFGARSR